MGRIIQSLWIGKRLSKMEQLSITSFLSHGHVYHLYVYDPIEGVPPGATLKDANEILPSSMIFQYREQGSYAGFSNYFRYKLLLERGGWWADTDVVCLRPFAFSKKHVLATERDGQGREFVTSGIICAPQGSKLMQNAWAVCRSRDPRQLKWGETGPNLLHYLALRLSFCDYVKPAEVFCPIDPNRWMEAILPTRSSGFGPATCGVHLWNEMWRRNGADKDESYAPGCLYERLKREYLKPVS